MKGDRDDCSAKSCIRKHGKRVVTGSVSTNHKCRSEKQFSQFQQVARKLLHLFHDFALYARLMLAFCLKVHASKCIAAFFLYFLKNIGTLSTT